MNNKYYVLIKHIETEETIRQWGPMPKRRAEKIEDGVNINLDHKNYYTEIEERILRADQAHENS